MSDDVKTKQKGAVLEVLLNRPDSLNSMNYSLIDGLFLAIEQAKDPSVRAVLIRGAGRGFCAGGDIASFAQRLKEGKSVPREMPDRLHEMIEMLTSLPKPVIASVHGPAAGAGMSLVLACDLAIASQGATFNLAYVGIGLSPDGGSSYYLPRHLGLKKAMEIFLLPRNVSAREALDLGLINQVVSNEDLEKESRALADNLAAGPTTAYASVKQMVNETYRNSLHDQLKLESDFIVSNSQTEDFKTGVTAFLGKETPKFTGK